MRIVSSPQPNGHVGLRRAGAVRDGHRQRDFIPFFRQDFSAFMAL
ncbi:hypothetical protein LTSEMIS_3548, partial [Salmonella enterica subsp. enterica serovar Mississippi str. A4-633]